MSAALRWNGVETRRAIIAGREPSWITKHPRAGYCRQAYLSVPEWVDRAELRWIDWCRRAWTLVTGVEQVLDHMVPLNHPRVCGLTVPWNFQLMPRAVNAYKGGHWREGQLKLQLIGTDGQEI